MQLSQKKSTELLKKYRIPAVDSVLIRKEQELSKIKSFPAAMKIDSPDIMHKSDEGCVIVNVGKDGLIGAYRKIISAAKRKKARINGVAVQPMVKGTEVIIGMKRDGQFGPVIMFGLGGIMVEVMKDVAFRIAPVCREEALKMINEIKGAKILNGYRNMPKADINKLAEIITKLSSLSLNEKSITEIDLNPVITGPNKAIAVDARILQ